MSNILSRVEGSEVYNSLNRKGKIHIINAAQNFTNLLTQKDGLNQEFIVT